MCPAGHIPLANVTLSSLSARNDMKQTSMESSQPGQCIRQNYQSFNGVNYQDLQWWVYRYKGVIACFMDLVTYFPSTSLVFAHAICYGSPDRDPTTRRYHELDLGESRRFDSCMYDCRLLLISAFVCRTAYANQGIVTMSGHDWTRITVWGMWYEN